MKSSNEKYRRRHWWKFTDWEDVVLNTIFAVTVGFAVFGLGWVIAHPSAGDSDKADSIADTVADTTTAMDSAQTKSDTAVFDTVISDTRVVVKSNRPVKVVVK